MPWLSHLLALINALVADRSRLTLENITLRQQIVVLKRSVKSAKIEDSDRIPGSSCDACSTPGAIR